MHNKRWGLEETNLLLDNYKKLSWEELYILFPNRSKFAVKCKVDEVKENKKKVYKWTKEEDAILQDNHLKLTLSELKDLLPNKTKPSIQHRFQKLNLYGREILYKNKVNEKFFETPNPICSYVAGFIAADGCISIRKERNSYEFSISQKEYEVIELFKNLLGFDGKISKATYRGYTWHSLTVTSKKMVQDLQNNFNIGPRKTHTLKPPNLDEYNTLCFIVGLVDGDGCIGFRDKNNPKSITFGLCGTKEICEFVKEKVGGHLSKLSCIYQVQCTHKMARNIIIKLRSLKELENIRFARKWDKILPWEQSQKAIA